jgi:hypothetical protein
MTTKDNGGPAFPAQHFDMADNEHGMTLRDYFAAKAMQAAICRQDTTPDVLPEHIAIVAYHMADAMLKVRAK